MSWLKSAIGWGIVIYAVMYLAWSGLVIYGLSLGIFSLIVRLAVLALITVVAVRSLELRTVKDILTYSVVWALCAIVLDLLFLVPFAGYTLYTSWSVWVGYLLVIVFPLGSLLLRNRTPKMERL